MNTMYQFYKTGAPEPRTAAADQGEPDVTDEAERWVAIAEDVGVDEAGIHTPDPTPTVPRPRSVWGEASQTTRSRPKVPSVVELQQQVDGTEVTTLGGSVFSSSQVDTQGVYATHIPGVPIDQIQTTGTAQQQPPNFENTSFWAGSTRPGVFGTCVPDTQTLGGKLLCLGIVLVVAAVAVTGIYCGPGGCTPDGDQTQLPGAVPTAPPTNPPPTSVLPFLSPTPAPSPLRSPQQLSTGLPTPAREDTEPPSAAISESGTSEFDLMFPAMAGMESLLPVSTVQAMKRQGSPQSLSHEWLVSHPKLEIMSKDRKLQLFVLVTFYHATQSWSFDARGDWLNVDVHECDWTPPSSTGEQVADCTDDGLYQKLVLENSNLMGTIPIEIFLLTHLTTLDLEGNQLVGAVPSEVGELHANLSFLDLRNNMLSGQLPSELGLVTAATGLNLRGNNLVGIIPSELAQLSRLEGLWLDNTGLSGSVPPELCSLTSWTYGVWIECTEITCPCQESDVCACA